MSPFTKYLQYISIINEKYFRTMEPFPLAIQLAGVILMPRIELLVLFTAIIVFLIVDLHTPCNLYFVLGLMYEY